MLAHDKESGLGSPAYVIENIQKFHSQTLDNRFEYHRFLEMISLKVDALC